MSVLEKLDLNKIFSVALETGGEFAELFYELTRSTQVYAEDRKLDRIMSGIDVGVGLRIISGAQSVYGYTTDITNSGLNDLAKVLNKVIAGKSAQAKPVAMTKVKPNFHYKIEKDPSVLSQAQRTDFALRADKAAWATKLDGLKQVSVGYLETFREIEIANSQGVLAKDNKQYLTFFTEVVGEKNGQTQTAYEVEGGFSGLELFDETPPEQISENAIRRLEILLNAKAAPSGTMPVVMAAEAGGTMIHEAVGHGLEADLACNGMSVYQNKIGQKVASPLITVIDDGTMPAKRGSFSVDDEGTVSKKNVLIENGILKSYMSDRLSHMKFGVPLTGNGRRQTYRHKPLVRMTNTYVASGKDRPEDILGQTKMGLYVKAMGGGQVNTVTGDFVFAVTEGYLIYDGELGPAVRGATLTGNGPSVLCSLDRLGSDLGFATGTCGKDGQGAPVTDAQPTIRIPEMVVGGEVEMSKYWSQR